jgi:menaquinone-9 beta-reductase
LSLDSTDVFVIGGGPAGLATAIAARQQGFRVMVADGATPPIDKPCGEALMPDAIVALAQMGVAVPAGRSFRLRGVRFLSAEQSAEAAFPLACDGLSIRRTALHAVMIERATELGVDLVWRSVVTGITSQEIHLRDRKQDRMIRARWIVGADGVRSRVRRWAGLDTESRMRPRYSFRRHYHVKPWTDCMEIYWGKTSQAYATGVSDDQVCVAVASNQSDLRLEELLPAFPQLAERLRGVEATSAERGSVTANRTLRRVLRGNVALVGDASGTVDAITGEGLGLSFHQALLLAQCLKSGSLAHYQAAHRRLARRPRFMARLMLQLDGRPRLQQRTLHIFRSHTDIFRRLLALHVGSRSPLTLAVDGLTFGWELLTA